MDPLHFLLFFLYLRGDHFFYFVTQALEGICGAVGLERQSFILLLHLDLKGLGNL